MTILETMTTEATDAAIDLDRRHVAHNYSPLPVVAAGAEGVAGRVVAVCRIEQANRHVVGHGERPGRFNQPGDLLPEPVHDAGK